MKNIFGSLFGKIAGVFLLLLVVLGGVQIFMALNYATRFVQETEQKLNRDLARNLAGMFQANLQDSINAGGIKDQFEHMMMMNPRVEYYLLEEDGRIIAYSAPPGRVQLDYVALPNIHRYLEGDGDYPILGDDPRKPGTQKPFSVTKVQLPDNRDGFLYVILGSEKYDSASDLAASSYVMQLTVLSLLVSLLLTGIVGLVLFRKMAQPFQRMIAGVKEFEGGKYGSRIGIESNDEIGAVSRAFDQMAGTIEANIAEMQRNDQLRRDLVANVSHDLRTPLASIQGYLETILMKDAKLSAQERVRFLDTVLGNVTILNKLVSELFELSKFDAREKVPQRELFAISELAQDIVLKLQPQAEEKDIRLKATLDKNLPFVYADIAMIDRAISNLIENAIRYSERGSDVTLELRRKGSSVTVYVRDNGFGIQPDELPHIFDRFYRVEKSRARDSGGTGLGLAITKKIVEAHDSSIAVESKPNQGSTFAFELQSAAEEKA